MCSYLFKLLSSGSRPESWPYYCLRGRPLWRLRPRCRWRHLFLSTSVKTHLPSFSKNCQNLCLSTINKIATIFCCSYRGPRNSHSKVSFEGNSLRQDFFQKGQGTATILSVSFSFCPHSSQETKTGSCLGGCATFCSVKQRRR